MDLVQALPLPEKTMSQGIPANTNDSPPQLVNPDAQTLVNSQNGSEVDGGESLNAISAEQALINQLEKDAFLEKIHGSYKLGSMYFYGSDGVTKNHQKAIKYLTLAGEEDHRAWFLLGLIFREAGYKDNQKAIHYLKPLADLFKCERSAYCLARIYLERGEYRQAYHYYGKCPIADVNATFEMACMLQDDLVGFTPNYSLAIAYLKICFGKGHAGSQYRLGWAYHQGKGCEQNIETAKEYYKLSAEKGNDDAKRALEELSHVG